MNAIPPDLIFDFRQQPQVKVVKQSENHATLPTKRERALKRIHDMQNEVGRLNRLLDELRADVLELGVE